MRRGSREDVTIQTAAKLHKTWAPQVPHTIVVVLTSIVVVLVVTAILVVAGVLVQDLLGGAPPAPLTPGPGLGL
jgi:hypothetical protein